MTHASWEQEWESGGLGSGVTLREAFYWVGPALVLLIEAGACFSFGYGYEDMLRAWGWIACGLLGVWGVAFWASGRFSLRPYTALRVLLAIGVGTLLWSGATLIPLPVDFVERVSPFWREALAAMRQAGYPVPDRVPLAITPEAAWRGWNQMAASLLYFIGACVVASRQRGFVILAVLVAGGAVVEAWIGAVVYVLGSTDRAFGIAYNSNHHAALVMLGLPIAAWWVATRQKYNRYGYMESQRRDLMLFLGGVVAVAFIGWMLALSRGSLLAVALVGLADVAMRLPIGRKREQGTQKRKSDGGGLLGVNVWVMGLIAASGITLLLFSSALEGFAARLPETEDLGGRAAYWLATLKGLAQVPLLGLGLGGAEASINRFLLGRPTSVLAVWSHNDYVQVVSELGLVWTAAVLGALVWFLRCFKREWDSGSAILGRRMRGFRRAALAGMAITLVHAFFDFHLRLPIVGFHFLLVGALLLTGTKAIGSRGQT